MTKRRIYRVLLSFKDTRKSDKNSIYLCECKFIKINVNRDENIFTQKYER